MQSAGDNATINCGNVVKIANMLPSVVCYTEIHIKYLRSQFNQNLMTLKQIHVVSCSYEFLHNSDVVAACQQFNCKMTLALGSQLANLHQSV